MEANTITAHASQQSDARLEPLFDALNQLSPSSQELIGTLIRQLAERENVHVADGPSTGLQNLIEGIPLWVAMLRSDNFSPQSIKVYQATVLRFLRQFPNPTTQIVRQHFAECLAQMQPNSVLTMRNALRSFFGYLTEEGLWNSNPLNGMKSLKLPKRIRQDPKLEEVQKLMQATFRSRRAQDEFQMLVVLLISMAFRIGEAVAIRKDQITLDGNFPGIRVIGKGDKERIVPLTSPFIKETLRAYLDRHSDNGPFLFPGRSGHWSRGSAEKLFTKACQQQGIKPKITPHSLRHFFATYALQHGAKAEVVSQMLGHASVGITLDIYRHVHPEEMWAEHARFAPLGDAPVLLEEGVVCQSGVFLR